jgi:hypothetical protein
VEKRLTLREALRELDNGYVNVASVAKKSFVAWTSGNKRL